MADPIAEWMAEVSTSLANLAARQQAVEKSIDQNTVAVTNASSAAAAAANALTRIAKTEEDRLKFEKDQAKTRAEQDRDDKINRNAWMTKLWTSQWVQLLIAGLVFFVLQALGVGYVIRNMLPNLTFSTVPAHDGGILPPSGEKPL